MFLRKVALSLTFLLFAFNTAFARPATQEETTAFKAAVLAYQEALNNNDIDKIADTLPPSAYADLGMSANFQSADKIKRSMIKHAKESAQKEGSLRFSDVKFDADKAKSGQFKNGQPYFIVPAQITISGGYGNPSTQHYHFIAVIQKGKWYFYDTRGQQQIGQFKLIYPGGNAFPGIRDIKFKKIMNGQQ